jgi:hypothetical protein
MPPIITCHWPAHISNIVTYVSAYVKKLQV